MSTTKAVWKDILARARASPLFIDTGQRQCHELADCVIVFTDPETFKDPLTEVRQLGWYYPPDEELRSVMLGEGDQHLYTFTQQIRAQIPRIVKMLKEHPQTRKAVLQLVKYDELMLDGAHTPALISALFRIRDSKLHVSVHARSVDLLIGLPANLFQTSVLGSYVAEQVGVPLGSVGFLINSAHVFEDYETELARVLQKP